MTEPGRVPWAWLLGWSVVAVAVASFVALVPLAGLPHVSDELAYTWQARLFAAGLHTGPAADDPALMRALFWVSGPDSHSPFPPGWSALLAVGEVVGAGALVNPLLAGTLPPLLWALSRRWADDATARLAAVVAALSPGIWVLAASRMSHTSVLVACAVAALVVSRPRDEPAPVWSVWLAGVAVAYLVLTRHFDAALVGGPLLLWGLWRVRDLPGVLGLCVPPALACGALLAHHHALSGDALAFPMNAYLEGFVGDRPGCNRLGFGADVGCHPTAGSWGHSPGKALGFSLDSAARLDRFLVGVPLGGLLALMGAWRLRTRLRPALVLGVLVVGGYALYWSPGAAYGARFWHPLYLVLPTLTAAGLLWVAGRWALPLLVAVTLGGGSRLLPDLASGFWCVDDGLVELLEAEGIHEGLVFLAPYGQRAESWPALGVDQAACNPTLEAGDGMALNDPARLQGGLQVRLAPADDTALDAFRDAHHPGVPAWLVVHDIAADTRTLQALPPRP